MLASVAAGVNARHTGAVPATPVVIESSDDPRLSDFVGLTDVEGRRRREGGEFFIAEGVTAIERLLTSEHTVRAMLLTPQKYERLARLLGELDAPVFVASKAVMAETVGFALHRGAVASARRRPLRTLEELLPTVHRIAVLEGLNDPENLGAIARSARAFGIEALLLDPTCIDPYYRRTVRVSMGEVLFLPVARATDWPGDLEVVHRHGFETWALTPAPDSDDIWGLELPERLALVLGAEGPGLLTITQRTATRRVRIPIADGVDSLNVGAAAAVAFAVTGPGRHTAPPGR
jgi:tRNA G18 (ribose-2'-O)-methylase SpoU